MEREGGRGRERSGEKREREGGENRIYMVTYGYILSAAISINTDSITKIVISL